MRSAAFCGARGDRKLSRLRRKPKSNTSSGSETTVVTATLGLHFFGKGKNSGNLMAERIHFDNDTVLKQINGQLDASTVPVLLPGK
jgi:hypothetical protein